MRKITTGQAGYEEGLVTDSESTPDFCEMFRFDNSGKLLDITHTDL